MQKPLSDRSLRNVVVIAFSSWVLLATVVFFGILQTEGSRVPFYFIQLLLALFGAIGCIGYFLSWRYWKLALVTTSVLYLAFYFLRFFGRFVLWRLDYYSFPLAVWQTVKALWLLVEKQFSEGWWIGLICTVSFEWLVPLLQVAILGALMWPSTFRFSERADKRRTLNFDLGIMNCRPSTSFRPTPAELAFIVLVAFSVGYSLYSDWFRNCCLHATRGGIAIAFLPALLIQLALSAGYVNEGNSFAPALFSVGIAIQIYAIVWFYRWARATLSRRWHISNGEK